MSENGTDDDTGDEAEAFFDEVCRIVGQCCQILSSNDAETDRAQRTYQLKRL